MPLLLRTSREGHPSVGCTVLFSCLTTAPWLGAEAQGHIKAQVRLHDQDSVLVVYTINRPEAMGKADRRPGELLIGSVDVTVQEYGSAAILCTKNFPRGSFTTCVVEQGFETVDPESQMKTGGRHAGVLLHASACQGLLDAEPVDWIWSLAQYPSQEICLGV